MKKTNSLKEAAQMKRVGLVACALALLGFAAPAFATPYDPEVGYQYQSQDGYEYQYPSGTQVEPVSPERRDEVPAEPEKQKQTKTSPNNEKASLIVTVEKDVVNRQDGKISLREAIAYAKDGDTITFSRDLQGKTINVNPRLGALVVNKSIKIDASGLGNLGSSTSGITLNGGWKTRILQLSSKKSLEIVSVDFEKGYAVPPSSKVSAKINDKATEKSNDNATEETADKATEKSDDNANEKTDDKASEKTDDTATEKTDDNANEKATDNAEKTDVRRFAQQNGGAIYSSGQLILRGCKLTECRADGKGGAIYSSGQLAMEDCNVESNESVGNGAGIYASAGQTQLAGCSINNNASSSVGGGMYVNGGSITLNNCTVENNVAYKGGGGIYLGNKGRAILSTSDVISNTTIDDKKSQDEPPAIGGGIYVGIGAELDAHDCQIVENFADKSEDVFLFVSSDPKQSGGVARAFNTTSSFTEWIQGSGNRTPTGEALAFVPFPVKKTPQEDKSSEQDGDAPQDQSDAMAKTIAEVSEMLKTPADSPSGNPPASPNGFPPPPGSRPSQAPLTNGSNGGSSPVRDGASEVAATASPGKGTTSPTSSGRSEESAKIADAPKPPRAEQTPSAEQTANQQPPSTPTDAPKSPAFVVSTELDVLDDSDGLTSLREALRDAHDGDTIALAPSLKGKTISIAPENGELVVDKAVKIDASHLLDPSVVTAGITLDGGGKSRVLLLKAPAGNKAKNPIEINGVTIVNGCAVLNGAGVCVEGCQASFVNCAIQNNTTEGLGGGAFITSGSSVKLINCCITKNSTSQAGGGVSLEETAELTLKNSVVADNASELFGGGLYIQGGVVVLYNSIVCQNKANQLGDDVYRSSNKGGGAEAYNTLSSFTAWIKSEGNPPYDSSLPLFADDKYFLVENSQAIDKGEKSKVETETDLVGAPRIVGASVDLGAYEFQGTTHRSAEAGARGEATPTE